MDNLINKRVNKILILERLGMNKQYASRACYYKCLCDCGKIFNTRSQELKLGKINSCGCDGKHYMTKSREYRTWSNMKSRCLNKNTTQYNDYGGRGITICDRWLDFNNFFEDMGYSNGLTIERIDNEKGYSPENCRWATRQEQNINTRRAKFIIDNGKKVSLKEIANKTNINYATLLRRFNEKGDLNLNKRVFINTITGVYYNSFSEIAKTLNEDRRMVQYKIDTYGEYKNYKLA